MNQKFSEVSVRQQLEVYSMVTANNDNGSLHLLGLITSLFVSCLAAAWGLLYGNQLTTTTVHCTSLTGPDNFIICQLFSSNCRRRQVHIQISADHHWCYNTVYWHQVLPSLQLTFLSSYYPHTCSSISPMSNVKMEQMAPNHCAHWQTGYTQKRVQY